MQMKKAILKTFMAIAMAFSCSVAYGQEKPNILVIMGDDDAQLVAVRVAEPVDVPLLPPLQRHALFIRLYRRARDRVAHHNRRERVPVFPDRAFTLRAVFHLHDRGPGGNVRVVFSLERRRVTYEGTRRGGVIDVRGVLRIAHRLCDDLRDALPRRVCLATPGLNVDELGTGHAKTFL